MGISNHCPGKYPTFFILFLASFLLLSCSPNPATQVEKPHFSFLSPEGWKITEDLFMEEEATYSVTTEKEGLNASGVVSVISIAQGDIFEVEDVLYNFQESMKASIMAQTMDIQTSEMVESYFGSTACQQMSMSFSILGIQESMDFFAFKCNDFIYVIMLSGAEVDYPLNQPGFEQVTQTFRCF